MVNVSPVIEPDGSTSAAVAVFSDVTEMKKLDTAKSMFVSLVAHEVKSPLAASEGWLNLVLSGVLKQDAAEERRMLERARLRLRTLRGLVNEILSLTALQTGTLALKRAPVDAAAVLGEIVENEREKAADRRIGITVERDESEPVQLLGDREALGMIYGNLVENAVKYSPDGGQVTVALRREGIYGAVSVADHGIGISPADCERIFEEFYRVRGEATAAIPGTGLGLSLVKRLTELHQGTVSVISTLGHGSEFTVRVPLAAPRPS
jgi:two-component system phosphate regulon sensor histidine kinase PhoR